MAFNTDGSFVQALDYTQQAYDRAQASRDSLGTELISQTLTSLANIYWAKEDYAEALHYARQVEGCAPPELLLGAQQVLARCLLSCNSLAEAEAVYRQMEPGTDVQAAYVIQSNLAKLALRRHDIEGAETAIDEAFGQAEELYYTALRQKDDYYQSSLRQELENERLLFHTLMQRRMILAGFIGFFAAHSFHSSHRPLSFASHWATTFARCVAAETRGGCTPSRGTAPSAGDAAS